MLTWPELNAAMGQLEPGWTPRRQAGLIVETDANLDGHVDFNEFSCWRAGGGSHPDGLLAVSGVPVYSIIVDGSNEPTNHHGRCHPPAAHASLNTRTYSNIDLLTVLLQ